MFKLLTLNWFLQQGCSFKQPACRNLMEYMFFMLVSFDTRCKLQVCEIIILFESFLKNQVGNCGFQTAPSNRMMLLWFGFLHPTKKISICWVLACQKYKRMGLLLLICAYGFYISYKYIADNALVSSTSLHAITVWGRTLPQTKYHDMISCDPELPETLILYEIWLNNKKSW